MAIAYVDTSVFVALAFGEASGQRALQRVGSFDTLLSAGLFEAELASAHAREQRSLPNDLLQAVSLVLPDRSLQPEIQRVLQAGYVRGADCLHVATALYLDPKAEELVFLTLDLPQRKIATRLGFST
jgi:predicted nucleic acid-binding protein